MVKIGDNFVLLPNHEKIIKQKGFTIGKVINFGNYGHVCTGTLIKDKTEIAVKIIDLKNTSDDYRQKFLPKELASLTTLKHKYIILVHNISLITNIVYVFMEKAFGGDLLEMLADTSNVNGIPESKVKVLYKGLASALQYIHSQGWAHRDIKSENILLANKERTIAKITDFGFSTSCFDPTTGRRLLNDTYCGSPFYTAPEVLKAEPYDAMKSDVWSLGVVLYVMVNNQVPFTQEMAVKLSKQAPKQFSLDFKNKNLSQECKDLILKHIDLEPLKRYTMAQVVAHSWLK